MVSSIELLLTKEVSEVNTSAPGYQEPLDPSLVQELSKEEFLRGDSDGFPSRTLLRIAPYLPPATRPPAYSCFLCDVPQVLLVKEATVAVVAVGDEVGATEEVIAAAGAAHLTSEVKANTVTKMSVTMVVFLMRETVAAEAEVAAAEEAATGMGKGGVAVAGTWVGATETDVISITTTTEVAAMGGTMEEEG
eukprot:GHVN01055455.1.p1 GENE.GHVN01055455.1~~GHVN01055455.1.p1  ORF type:complete len:192 (-),score=33.31 GHVN01055455.1:560-1135(-)